MGFILKFLYLISVFICSEILALIPSGCADLGSEQNHITVCIKALQPEIKAYLLWLDHPDSN